MARPNSDVFMLTVDGETIPLKGARISIAEERPEPVGPLNISFSFSPADCRIVSADPVMRELVELGVQDRVAMNPNMSPNELREAEGFAAYDVFLESLFRLGRT